MDEFDYYRYLIQKEQNQNQILEDRKKQDIKNYLNEIIKDVNKECLVDLFAEIIYNTDEFKKRCLFNK
jgi:hypothetical protein